MLLEGKVFAGLDLKDFGVRIGNPYRAQAGIVDHEPIGRELQILKIIPGLIDLHVGGIPDVLMALHFFYKGFDHFPVVGGVKFVGVSP